MYIRRIKDLREDHDYSQNTIANLLNVNRSTYANWENGDIIIPLEKLDELTIIYETTLAYLLGLEQERKDIPIKPMDYDSIIATLNELKMKHKHTFETIAQAIGVSVSCCYKYYKKQLSIPIDKLISLAQFYNINLDELCKKI